MRPRKGETHSTPQMQSTPARNETTRDARLYSAMATRAAPPTINHSSRAKLAVEAAESVCRPGAGPVRLAAVAVWVGWMTVTRVTVLCWPLGKVVVLL